MSCFEDKLLDWIELNHLFDGFNKILLAVSGGADSVVMTHALHRLRQQGRLHCDFMIGHVNHGLRAADSDGDEIFVIELGRQLGIEVVTVSVPVRDYAEQNKLSIETAGRILRLKMLAAIARKKKCDAIATAHHKDDLAETIIHRLMRGTGFRGLCGILPVSVVYGGTFIRPLLNVRRCEVIQYAAENNLVWRQDASNRNVDFTRNRIRHQLLPVLQAECDAIVDRLSALSEKSRRFLLETQKQAESILAKGQMDPSKGEFILEQALLGDCPPWVFYEVVRGVLTALEVGLRNYRKEHFDLICQLLQQNKAKADFPNGIEVVVGNGRFHVRLKPDAVETIQSCILKIGQTVQFGPWRISSKLSNRSEVDIEQFLKTKDAFVEWFDADKISGEIEIRQRQNGDRFCPIGAKGPKKVGRFLMDAGLDPQIKKQAFIVKDTKKILWLAPVRMSEQVKVTEQTTQILEIQTASTDGGFCSSLPVI